MDNNERLFDALAKQIPAPLDDPGNRRVEILEGVEMSTDLAVARMQRRLAVAAEKCLANEAARSADEQKSYTCLDCLDTGWIYVPCRERGCSECGYRSHHLVVRACMSCDLGIAHEAGIWFRRVASKDRRGKPVVNDSKMAAFSRIMSRRGQSGVRVRAMLDRMIAGESERRPDDLQ